MQWAFDAAIFYKAVREPSRAMGAQIMQRVDFVSLPYQYDRRAVHAHTEAFTIRDILLSRCIAPVHCCAFGHIG
jgi:hypothetical protein